MVLNFENKYFNAGSLGVLPEFPKTQWSISDGFILKYFNTYVVDGAHTYGTSNWELDGNRRIIRHGTSSTTGGYVAFSGTNVITGDSSSATLTPSSTTESVTLANNNTLSLTSGYANPELQPDSGQIVYLENRKPISRA